MKKSVVLFVTMVMLMASVATGFTFSHKEVTEMNMQWIGEEVSDKEHNAYRQLFEEWLLENGDTTMALCVLMEQWHAYSDAGTGETEKFNAVCYTLYRLTGNEIFKYSVIGKPEVFAEVLLLTDSSTISTAKPENRQEILRFVRLLEIAANGDPYYKGIASKYQYWYFMASKNAESFPTEAARLRKLAYN